MGYLNNQVVEIDAILTKKGRELLAKNPEEFSVAKFALADDEVDYRLWNPNHALGTDYYGEVIENMPVLEGSPNESQMMKYKLITMDKNTSSVPTVTIPQTSISLTPNQRYLIVPADVGLAGDNASSGYTFVLTNTSFGTLEIPVGQEVQGATAVQTGTSYSQTVIGHQCTLIALGHGSTYDETVSGTVTITGNNTGGRVTLRWSTYYY